MSFLTKKADELLGWVDARFPLTAIIKSSASEYLSLIHI